VRRLQPRTPGGAGTPAGASPGIGPGTNGCVSGWYDPVAIAVPLVVSSPRGTMSFLSTTMLFGSPLDVTLSELAIEIFLPADTATVERLRAARS